MSDFGNWNETQAVIEKCRSRLAELERWAYPHTYPKSGGGMPGVEMRCLRRTIATMEASQAASTHRDDIGGHTGPCVNCALFEMQAGDRHPKPRPREETVEILMMHASQRIEEKQGRPATEEEITAALATCTSLAPDTPPHQKNPAAVAMGRLGGSKGGKARAAALSPERRSEISKMAAAARWKKPESQ